MTATAETPRQLELFVLVRLLAAGKAPGRSDFLKDFKPFFADRLNWAESDWKTTLDDTLDQLVRDGQIQVKPYALTDAGREAAMTFLGISALPPAIRWPTLRDRYLVARALGIDPADKDAMKKVSSGDGVRAAVLVRHYELPGNPVPSKSRVRHMLAWQQLQQAHSLDVPATTNFSVNAVLQATVAAGQKGDDFNLLAAQAVKAKKTAVNDVRVAAICQWLGRADTAPKPTAAAQSKSFDLEQFAQRVREIARTTTTGRFGDNKVFISHVWERCHAASEVNGMSRDEFNQHLVEANKRDLLTLSRADLVSAMDPQDVAASEIRLPHSTFHFIRTDR